jgi:hypothetical protein
MFKTVTDYIKIKNFYKKAGKPVVSTPLDEITKSKDCEYLADSDEFADQIRKALRETSVGYLTKGSKPRIITAVHQSPAVLTASTKCP